MTATDLADIHLPADAVSQLRATDSDTWIYGHGFPVNRRWWTIELTKHGLDDTILGDRITRGDVFNLAEPALDDPAAALTLLWNAVAWGSDTTQRNNKARIASIAADPDSVGALLQQAARLSREDPRAAYALLRPGDHKPAIKELGPAFFTKYLYFAGGGNAHHRCCILDRNVAASLNRTCGWASLPIDKWNWLATAYERYAILLDRWVDHHQLPRRDLIERWLFEDGKTINS